MVGKGIVIKTDGQRATVKIKKTSACAHNCEDCEICQNPEYETTVINAVGAQAGDTVLIEAPGKSILFLAFLTYVLPVAGSFLAYAAGAAFFKSTAAGVLTVAVWLAAWLLFLRRYSSKKVKMSTILEVVNEKN